MESNFLRSSFREKVLEHIFIGECLRRLWQRGIHDVEVLRSEVDGSGYDIVIEASEVVRYIQLKASFNGSTVRDQKINGALARKPGGCVVWIGFDQRTLQLGPYYWFGADPADRLNLDGLQHAKHTKADAGGKKATRRNTFVVPRARFIRLEHLDELIDQMFPARTQT